MTVLAHGALGHADGLVLLVPVVALLVLATGALHRHRAQRGAARQQARSRRR